MRPILLLASFSTIQDLYLNPLIVMGYSFSQGGILTIGWY